MGLILQLKPNERVAINGAVITNPHSSNIEIKILNRSTVLRERDFMTEEEATTPCRRLYFLGMLAMLDEANLDHHREAFTSWLGEIMGALRNPTAIAAAAELGKLMADEQYHQVLKGCRILIDYEDFALRGITEEAVAA